MMTWGMNTLMFRMALDHPDDYTLYYHDVWGVPLKRTMLPFPVLPG